MARNVVAQALKVDLAGLQNQRRILVFRQCEQEMFEGDLCVALLAGIVARAHQGSLKRWRHRDSAQLVPHSLHHSYCHSRKMTSIDPPFYQAQSVAWAIAPRLRLVLARIVAGTRGHYRSFTAELQPTSQPQSDG